MAKAGHNITVVARGSRLESLSREGAIISADGQRASVKVISLFDPATYYDLVIVTVQEHQVSSLLPTLTECHAKTILLMFNTFAGTKQYRSILGAKRFAFGFPNMSAFFEDDYLRFQVDGLGMVTTLTRQDLADLFKGAGLPSEVEIDMDAFLRSHVALVLPFFLAALLTWDRKWNLTLGEARSIEQAWGESFHLVRSLDHPLKPRFISVLAMLPTKIRVGLLCLASRLNVVKKLGVFGPTEMRSLIDTMVEIAPNETKRLASLRP